jgi:hypothetical protein
MSANLRSPTRMLIPAVAATMIALVAVGMLGVASAEAPTTAPPPRTVSVQGVANQPIDQSASAATATTVYRQGMAAAVSDGQAKAQFLATQAGATLGPVQNIAEDGGYIECAGDEEYLGEQPDFGYADTGISTAGVSSPRAVTETTPGARKPVVKHSKKKRKGPSAKRAVAASCTLSAQVSLVYPLS